MSGHQTATVDDTVYFWFGANDTSGSGGDGATALYDVREAGAATDAIPLLSGSPTLLSHANYPAGCYEIAVAATTGNGFAANDTFGVFCTLAIDSQNPTGFVGSCTLTPLAKTGALQTVDDNVDSILTDTNELQTNQGNWLTVTGHATETKQDIISTNVDQIEAAVITNAAGADIAADIIAVKAETANILVDTGTTLDGKVDTIAVDVAGLDGEAMRGTDGANTTVPDVAGTAATPAEVATALTDIKLDHLVAVADADDPVNDSIMAKIAASDGDWSGFDNSTDSLEAIRDRGDTDWSSGAAANPNLLLEAEIATVTDQTHFTLATGSDIDDAYNDQAIVLYDDSNSDYPSTRVISDYVGATKTVTIDSAPVFTLAADDSIKIFVTAPGTTAPTVGQIRIEMDDNSTQFAAIVADTNELQTDDVPGLISAHDSSIDTQLADIPTVAEFEARSIVSADYVVVGDTIAGVTDVTNQVTADVTAISGDSAAADNLEATYDGTGYQNDEAPATQSQVSNIASGTAATNQTVDSFTAAGTEVETNTYADTYALDGTIHLVEPGAGTTDFYYEFDIGANGSPVSITWHGYAASQGDSYLIYAYNWVTTAWEQIGTKAGANGTNVVTETYDLSIAHVGTAANAGLVRYRVYSTGATTGTGYGTDRILCSFATVYQSVGYADGAIWVDTVNGTAGTTDYINGTADNPVLTWANALTLSASLGIKRFHITNGSTIQLSANSDNYTLLGNEWNLDLNGQSIAGMFADHANIYGVSTGTSYRFMMCKIAISTAITLAAGGMRACAVGDAGVTVGAGTYLWDACFSGVAGIGTTYVDFNSAGDTNLNMRHYSGGIEIRNLGHTGTDNMSLEGQGQYVLNANCVGGTLAVRGAFQKTDNSGLVTISDEANIFTGVMDAGRAQAGGNNTITLAVTASASAGAYDPSQVVITGGTGEGQCRLILEYNGTSKIAVVDRNWKTNPDATSDYNIVTHPGREHVNEGLAQAGAAGTITLNALASAGDDAYNNQLIFLRSGTGEDQVRLVTDYDGTTKIATVNKNWAVNPDATTGYVMLPTSIYTEAEFSALVTGAAPTTAEIRTAMEASGSDLHYLMIDLVNKKVITEASGNTEQFNDANGSIGTIAAAYDSDGTYTTRLRMVQ